jgi:hypothetical protein
MAFMLLCQVILSPLYQRSEAFNSPLRLLAFGRKLVETQIELESTRFRPPTIGSYNYQ